MDFCLGGTVLWTVGLSAATRPLLPSDSGTASTAYGTIVGPFMVHFAVNASGWWEALRASVSVQVVAWSFISLPSTRGEHGSFLPGP